MGVKLLVDRGLEKWNIKLMLCFGWLLNWGNVKLSHGKSAFDFFLPLILILFTQLCHKEDNNLRNSVAKYEFF